MTCVVSQLAHGEHADLDPESLRDDARALPRRGAARSARRHGGSVGRAARRRGRWRCSASRSRTRTIAQRALRAAAELRRTQELPFGARARCGVCTGEVVTRGRRRRVGDRRGGRRGRAACPLGGDAARSGWTRRPGGWCATARTASALSDGGFLLHGLDADAPAIRRRLDRPLIGREDELGRLRAAFARVVDARTPRAADDPRRAGHRQVAPRRRAARDRGRRRRACSPAAARPTARASRTGRCARSSCRRRASAPSTSWRRRSGVAPSAARSVAAGRRARGGQRRARTPAGRSCGSIDALARERPLDARRRRRAPGRARAARPAARRRRAASRDAPALVVWVARPDLLERHPDRARRIEAQNVLALRPLSDAASAALLEAIAGGRLEPGEQRRIAEAAGGNPLFLEQLVAYCRRATGAADALPPALHALLAARLDRLDAAERSALALGAVAGDAFAAGCGARAGRRHHARRARAGVRAARAARPARPAGPGPTPAAALPPRPGPRGRLRVAGEVRAGAAARAPRRLAGRARSRAAGGRRADRASTSRPPAATSRRSAPAPPAELLARAGAGSRRRRAWRAARGDLPGEIGFLDRAVALLGTDREQGAALLPALVSALVGGGRLAPRRGARGPGGVDERRARPRRARARDRRSSASGSGSRATPRASTWRRAVAVVEHASATLRDARRRARARACRLPDVRPRVADGRPGGVLRRTPSGCSLTRAAPAAGSTSRRRSSSWPGAWSRGRGRSPRRSRAAMRWRREAAGQRAAELTLRGCRAVLMAMTGRYDEARAGMAEARAGLAELQPGRHRRLPRAARGDRRDPGGRPGGGRARRPRRRGDHLRVRRPLVPVVHPRRPRARDPRPGAASPDAAEAVARIETMPAPCDARVGDQAPHRAGARSPRRRATPSAGSRTRARPSPSADATGLVLCRANAHRTLAELLLAQPGARTARRSRPGAPWHSTRRRAMPRRRRRPGSASPGSSELRDGLSARRSWAGGSGRRGRSAPGPAGPSGWRARRWASRGGR